MMIYYISLSLFILYSIRLVHVMLIRMCALQS